MSEVKRWEKLEELNSYFKEIQNYTPLTRRAENKLAEKIKKGDERALQKLVQSNLKFVITIAKQYRNTGVSFSDLISEGNVGLIKAARKFDETKGVKFISYAVWWIRASIQECVDNYKKHNEFFADEFVFNKQSEVNYEYTSDVINSEFEAEMIDAQSRNASIETLMETLERREIRILALYFGLYGNKERTLDEIGEEMGLTKERVRQIKDKAIIKLKCNALMSDEFDVYSQLTAT